jgi:hypothetical protein
VVSGRVINNYIMKSKSCKYMIKYESMYAVYQFS